MAPLSIFKEVSGHWDLIKSEPGNRGLSACVTIHEAMSRISSWDRPHPEMHRERREPLQDKTGESTLLSWSGGEKAFKRNGAGNFGVPLKWDRYVGELLGSHQGCQVLFRTSRWNVGLLLRRCSGKVPHIAMMGEPLGFSRVTAGFSSYDGDFRIPLVLDLGSPNFPSSCEGKLDVVLEPLQGQRDLI